MVQKLVSEVNQRSTKDTIVRSYYIYDDDHMTDVEESQSIVDAYAEFYQELGIEGTDHDFERETDHSVRVWIRWEPGRHRNLLKPDLGANGRAIRWKFSRAAKGKRAYYTKNRYLKLKPGTPNSVDFTEDVLNSDLIGFTRLPNQMARVSGIDIRPPIPTLIAELHVRASEVTGQFFRDICGIIGTVASGTGGNAMPNPATKLGRDAFFTDPPTVTLAGHDFEEGELFLSTVSGGKLDSERWVLNFGIAFEANRRNVLAPKPLDGAGGFDYNIRGHDLFWTFDEPDVDTFGGQSVLLQKPAAAFVDQVWDYADWGKIQFPTVLETIVRQAV